MEKELTEDEKNFKDILVKDPYGCMKALHDEIQALREWKEKARPFLESKLRWVKDIPRPTESDKQCIKTLTELLGEE